LRRLFKIVPTQLGYEVILAPDGERAISRFIESQDKIQLVIVDIVMPKKSGKDVYDKIKIIRPDMKVLFCSGYTADVIEQDSFLAEKINLITKPISPKALLETVWEVLDK
jgi:DNA-binding NtrC family response regulator